jgi:hypothetical protein
VRYRHNGTQIVRSIGRHGALKRRATSSRCTRSVGR